MMWRRGDEEETRALTHHHHHGGDIESTKKRTTTTTTRSSSSSVFGGKLAVVAATACATFALAPLCYLQGARSTINNGAATNASSSSSSSVLTEQKPRTRSNDLNERGMLLGARSFDEGRSTGVEYDREKRINLSTEKKASTATFAKKFVEAYEHEKVEQRRRSGEDTSSSSSSSSSSNKNNNLISALGSSKSKVPIYVIALEDRPEEFEKYEAIRAVFPTAEPTHGVDPLQWPNRIEDAQYAVKG